MALTVPDLTMMYENMTLTVPDLTMMYENMTLTVPDLTMIYKIPMIYKYNNDIKKTLIKIVDKNIFYVIITSGIFPSESNLLDVTSLYKNEDLIALRKLLFRKIFWFT